MVCYERLKFDDAFTIVWLPEWSVYVCVCV